MHTALWIGDLASDGGKQDATGGSTSYMAETNSEFSVCGGRERERERVKRRKDERKERGVREKGKN